MLALARGVLDIENDNFRRGFVYLVVDEVAVPSRYKFSDTFKSLPPPNPRKQDEILK
jgi:hypothetical protein